MKSKSFILIAIALGCGLVASIGISQVMGRSQTKEKVVQAKVETETVLVAINDLDIGATFTSENVKQEKWPKGHAPEGAVVDIESLKGRFPRVRVTKGQPIMQSMLMDSLDKKIIPDGYRVIPIKVSADTVSGLVLPGDRVDVLILLRKGNEIQKTMVRTVLKDVRIFDVNSQTERIIEEGQTRTVKTISLLLKPSKVELMTLAMELGKLRLSLRRHNDTKGDTDYSGAGLEELLGTAAEEGSEPAPTIPIETAVQTPVTAPIVAPVQTEPLHTMRVLTPSGITEFTWTDMNKPPQVSELGKDSSSASPSTSSLGIPALGPESNLGGAGATTVEPSKEAVKKESQQAKAARTIEELDVPEKKQVIRDQ